MAAMRPKTSKELTSLRDFVEGRIGRHNNGSLNTQFPLMEMKRNIEINKNKTSLKFRSFFAISHKVGMKNAQRMVWKEAAKAPSKLKYRMTAKLKTKSERKNVCHTASNLSIKIFSFSPLEAIFRRFIDSHRSWFGLFLLLLVVADVDLWRFEPSAFADHVCKSLPRPMNGIRFHLLIDGFRVNSGEIFSSSACEPHVIHHCSVRSSWGDDWWHSGGVERAGWRENQWKHARNIGFRACSLKNTERLITDVRRSKTIDEIENPSMFEKKCLTHKSATQPKRDDLENENLFSETGEKITKCLIENRFWYQRDENCERGWSRRKVPKHLNPAAAIVQQLNLSSHLNSTDSWKALWLNEIAF